MGVCTKLDMLWTFDNKLAPAQVRTAPFWLMFVYCIGTVHSNDGHTENADNYCYVQCLLNKTLFYCPNWTVVEYFYRYAKCLFGLLFVRKRICRCGPFLIRLLFRLFVAFLLVSDLILFGSDVLVAVVCVFNHYYPCLLRGFSRIHRNPLLKLRLFYLAHFAHFKRSILTMES